MQKMLRDMLVTTVSSRFSVSAEEVRTLLEGKTQKTLSEACNVLASDIEYDDFVKIVSKNR